MNLPTPRKLYRGLRKMLRFLARPARRGGRRGGRVIQTYRGYGSRRSVFLIGRVFRQPGIGLNLKEGPSTTSSTSSAARCAGACAMRASR
ncbi:hypothetical protein ASALC70_00890 [Alcanivorax sp. ALC70]|nr:hypothetical protein ASALC70_00890 [Alcanivorax sp. ALC70]